MWTVVQSWPELNHAGSRVCRGRVEQLHEALRTTDQRTKITASSRICRVNVDQAWIVISAAPDFFSLYAVRAPMLTRAAPVLARP